MKKISKKPKMKKRVRLSEDKRIVDLVERFGAASLYMNTHLGQMDIAKVLGMDNNRINEILKGISKQKQHVKEKS